MLTLRNLLKPTGIFLVIVVVVAMGYFIYLNTGDLKNLSTSPDTGSPVDHATYLEIQNLMLATELGRPEVVEQSLRSYDIDGDGDKDVLGFVKRTYSSNTWFFLSTWYRDEKGFSYDKDDYRQFQQFTDELECQIVNLEVKKVTLECLNSGGKDLITLRYQEKGGGYYRDVDVHALSFNNDADWPEYSSKKGGIQFNYPSDVTISEKTYKVLDDLITVISASRGGKTLFEVHSVPQEDGLGGGVINIAHPTVFIKLADDSYLSRDRVIKHSLQESGVFYTRAHAYKKNSTGDIFSSYDMANVHKGRRYTLFTPIVVESELKEIDTIFSSIKYTGAPAFQDKDTIIAKNNTIIFANVVTLEVPGNVSEEAPFANDPSVITSKGLEISFISSPVYQPAYIDLELYPFGSVGGGNSLGGGGYNLEKKACTQFDNDEVVPLQKIGPNEACSFGFGDAGYSRVGYYVLDPGQRYILSISLSSLYWDFHETLSPDFESIVESIRFTNL
jgi:hypothetical protein